MHQLAFDFCCVMSVTRRYADADDKLVTIRANVQARSVRGKLGPSSVFDLALVQIKPVKLSSAPKRRPHSRVIEKAGGRVRIVVDERDTAEWQEREFQRRARQVMPKPPKAALTKGEKLLKLIGEK